MADAAPALPAANNSPLHQPARDNAGNLTPTPAAHVQKPDAPASRTGLIADSIYDGLPPDQQRKYARMPRAGDQGGSEWVDRSTISKPADAAAANGETVKVGDMQVTQAELQEFFAAKGEAELKKATLPATPEAFEARLPENFEMPAGVEFKIDEKDPLLADARRWAHAKGLDQATFSELVGIYASAKAKEAAFIATAQAAEVTKLGANGTQRVTALETWMRGVVGDKLAGPMRSMMVTADIVRGLEIIQHRQTSQGAASFSQAGRVPGQASNKPSEEQWAKMSPAERMDFTNNTDQSQFRVAR